MSQKNEGKYASDWLLKEGDEGLGRLSRENVVLIASQTIKSGDVLEFAASGNGAQGGNNEVRKYSAGAFGFAGVALEDHTTAAGVKEKIAVVARNARIHWDSLGAVTHTGSSTEAVLAGLMAAQGIHPVDPENITPDA